MTMIILAVKAEHAYTGVWECLVFQLAHICHALRFFPAAAAVDTVQHMHIFHLMPSSHFASKPLLYIAWACLKASAMSPEAHRPMAVCSDQSLPIGREHASGDLSCVLLQGSKAGALIVEPQLHKLVSTTACQYLPIRMHCNAKYGACLRSLQLPYGLASVAVPISQLPVGSWTDKAMHLSRVQMPDLHVL